MIYLDASAVLARIFAEDRFPADEVWQKELISSRLIQYETWVRINGRGVGEIYADDANSLLRRIRLLELSASTLSRAFQPFPLPVRTLDALHLATIDFLRVQGQAVELLSYDKRMLTAAEAMGVALYPNDQPPHEL